MGEQWLGRCIGQMKDNSWILGTSSGSTAITLGLIPNSASLEAFHGSGTNDDGLVKVD